MRRRSLLFYVFLCAGVFPLARPAQAQIFFDDFEDGDISDWIIEQTGTPNEMVLRPDNSGFARSGSWAVYASCDNGGDNDHEIYMRRVVPCDGQHVYISVWMRQGVVGVFEGSDYFQIGYRPDASSPWTDVRWTDDRSDTYQRYVVDAGIGTSTFEIRFLFNDSAGEEDYYIDDVAVFGPPNADVTRTLPAQFSANVPFQVTLTAAPNAGGPITVTEGSPLTPSNIVASAGTATVNGTTITWQVNVTSTETLTYEVTPPNTCDPKEYVWAGTYDAGTGWQGMAIGGDTSVWMASDGWENDDIPWAADIDIPTGLQPEGRADYFACDDSYLLWGDGSDIWDNADGFHFLYLWVLGDFAIQSEVEMLPPSVNNWEKGGVMVRANLTPGSPHVMLIICSACRNSEPHIVAQERVDQDGGSQRFDNRPDSQSDGTVNPNENSRIPNTGTAVVSIARFGQTISVGADNLTEATYPHYSLFPWYSADRPNIPTDRPVAVGLVYTSHSGGVMDKVRFSNVSLVVPPSGGTGQIITPPVESVTRDIQATTYSLGQPIHVVITINRKAAGALTVTEIVPPNWTVSNMSPSGTQNGTTVTFTNVTGDTIEYDVTPGGSASPWPVVFSGQVTDANNWFSWNITGDVAVAPADRTIFQDGMFPSSSYTGCADTYIIMYGTGGVAGNRNQGGYAYLEEGDWYGVENPFGAQRTAPGFDDNKLILIRFELQPAIPRGSTVQDARLRLYYVGQRRGLGDPPVAQNIDHYTWVHMINKPWGEGTGGGPDGRAAAPGEVSWLSARTGIEDWETSGCRGLSDIRPPLLFQSQSAAMYGTQPNVWVEYDVTDFVREWVNNPAGNFGMKISQDDQGYYTSGYHFGAYDFCSSDYPADPTLRPILSVKWEEAFSLDARHWSLYR